MLEINLGKEKMLIFGIYSPYNGSFLNELYNAINFYVLLGDLNIVCDNSELQNLFEHLIKEPT